MNLKENDRAERKRERKRKEKETHESPCLNFLPILATHVPHLRLCTLLRLRSFTAYAFAYHEKSALFTLRLWNPLNTGFFQRDTDPTPMRKIKSDSFLSRLGFPIGSRRSYRCRWLVIRDSADVREEKVGAAWRYHNRAGKRSRRWLVVSTMLEGSKSWSTARLVSLESGK